MNALEQTLNDLTNAMYQTQAELSAHQLLLVTVLSSLACDPVLLDRLQQTLRQAYEGVQATNLNLPLPDDVLQRQREALLRLLPESLRSSIEGHD